MTNWTETYRGAMPPWQCDATEHFTVAYYFDRLEEADANLADEPGIGDLPHRADLSCRIKARFARELRAGASFHIESAALSADNGLRLGHRFVDSVNGEVVTWFEEDWDLSASPLTSRQRGAIEGRLAVWNGSAKELRPERTASSPRPAAGSSPVTSTRLAISPSVRSCIAFPTPPASLALRSAWTLLSCNNSGAVFNICADPAHNRRIAVGRALSSRNWHRPSWQLFAANDPLHD